MANKLTREQVEKLKKLLTRAVPTKTSRIYNDLCDCRIYLYNKETDIQPECAKSWFEFCLNDLVYHITKDKEEVVLILTSWFKLREHQSLHLIDYLSDCYDKIHGKEEENSGTSPARVET